MRSARLLRALGFGALICLDVAAAAGVAAAVGPDEGRGGTFWGAVVVVILLLAGLAYLTIRAASELWLDRRQLGSRALWRHGWKVSLIPLFFHVPDDVKYLCGTILCASLVVDLVLEVPEQRLREWVGAAFGAAAVLNFLSEVAGI